MNIRQLTAALLLVCLPTCALGQPSVLLINSSLADNNFIYARNAASPPTKTQRVLSSTNKALMGLSLKDSVIRANASVTDRFITNDTFGSGGDTYYLVSGLTLDGQLTAGQGTVIAFDADGVELDGQYVTVEKNLIKNFAGSGVVLRAFQIARNNLITGCINGVEVVSSDTVVAHNESINDFQNAGVWINTTLGVPGHTLVVCNHIFGGPYCLKNDGGDYVDSSGNMYADAHFGVWEGGGDGSKFVGDSFQHNRTRSIYVGVTNVGFYGCRVNVQHKVDQSGLGGVAGCVGVDFLAAGDGSHFIGGAILMENYSHPSHTNPVAAEAILVAADDATFTDVYLTDVDGKNGTIGVRTVGAIKGGKFEFVVRGSADGVTEGFEHSTDRLLIIADAGLRSCSFVFRGAHIDTTDPGKYIDAPADWKPAGSGNSITLTNTTTGTSVELTNQAY